MKQATQEKRTYAPYPTDEIRYEMKSQRRYRIEAENLTTGETIKCDSENQFYKATGWRINRHRMQMVFCEQQIGEAVEREVTNRRTKEAWLLRFVRIDNKNPGPALERLLAKKKKKAK